MLYQIRPSKNLEGRLQSSSYRRWSPSTLERIFDSCHPTMSPNVHLSPFALSDRLHRADSDAFTTELVASATLFCHGGQAGLYAVPSAVFPTWGLHDMPNQYVTYQMVS